MKSRSLIILVLATLSGFSHVSRADDRSLHCKLFETTAGKMLTMGGAFSKIQSGSPDELQSKDYALIVDRTQENKPAIKVLNKAKKAVFSAAFEMSRKESSYAPFKLQLANEQENLRLECTWQ